MLDIDDEKLPPPTPASGGDPAGSRTRRPARAPAPWRCSGTSRISAEKIVQLRPPNRATAKVYGSRSTEPDERGHRGQQELPAGSKPYAGPRNSTSTDHMLQIEKPMCSERIEKIRLRRATRAPPPSQNTSSSDPTDRSSEENPRSRRRSVFRARRRHRTGGRSGTTVERVGLETVDYRVRWGLSTTWFAPAREWGFGGSNVRMRVVPAVAATGLARVHGPHGPHRVPVKYRHGQRTAVTASAVVRSDPETGRSPAATSR